jgi:hypothetical protein
VYRRRHHQKTAATGVDTLANGNRQLLVGTLARQLRQVGCNDVSDRPRFEDMIAGQSLAVTGQAAMEAGQPVPLRDEFRRGFGQRLWLGLVMSPQYGFAPDIDYKSRNANQTQQPAKNIAKDTKQLPHDPATVMT